MTDFIKGSSNAIKKFSLYCVTDAKFEEVWSYSTPTKCPINDSHTIDTDQISVIEILMHDHGLSLTPNEFTLQQAKDRKNSLIDAKTSELIAQGFTYGGKVFSLSVAAQSKMMGSHQVRDDVALTYPIKWNTLDDSDYHEIQDADDLHAFYLTGVGTYRYHTDMGTSLKDLVRAATTVSEVEAVEDPR